MILEYDDMPFCFANRTNDLIIICGECNKKKFNVSVKLLGLHRLENYLNTEVLEFKFALKSTRKSLF